MIAINGSFTWKFDLIWLKHIFFKERKLDITLLTRSRSQQYWQKVFELLPTIQCDEYFLSEKESEQEVIMRDPFEGF